MGGRNGTDPAYMLSSTGSISQEVGARLPSPKSWSPCSNLPKSRVKEKVMSSLEDYIKELRDTGKPLVVSKLVNLSDLSSKELDVFDRAWPGIDVARRRELAERLAELAQDNLDLDFDKVLRTCLFDADSEVKIRAMEGLLECEERSLLAPLINLLMGDLEYSVRAAAASTLGTFALLVEFSELSANDAAKVEKALFTAYNNKNEQADVRCRALEAVSTISKPKVDDLIRQE